MARRPTDDLGVTPPPRLNRESGAFDVDAQKLWESLDKMASAVNRSARHTEQIPEIKRKVNSTGDKVVELDTKMMAVTHRLTRVEDKVDEGHSCQKEEIISEIRENQREVSQKMELDVQKGVRQSGEISALREGQSTIIGDVQDIKRAPQRMFYGLIGIVVTVLLGAGGAIWFLAELNKDVEFERTQRTQEFKRIESQIKSVGERSDNTPVKLAIEELEVEIEESGGQEKRYDSLCEGMMYHERRYMKKTLMKRGRRIPESCMQ